MIIADFKFHDGDESVGPRTARAFLLSIGVHEDTIVAVEQIIRHISFKGEKHVQAFKSAELDVVQDADRLDAIGAVGIARVFSYGGHRNRRIYDPERKPKLGMTKEQYVNHRSTSLNHFYEKLLLLKDMMNTQTGKQMAQQRHTFMESYLEEFYKEWEGKL